MRPVALSSRSARTCVVFGSLYRPTRLPLGKRKRKGSFMTKLKLATGIALLGLGVGLVGVALGDNPPKDPTNHPKYTRNQDVKIDVKLSDRVKPIQPKDPSQKSQVVPEL